ncbi:MAG: ATP-dependent sacrificial sulfur transferase LarE [Oscillospiraceae bacterium]|nr:ATP-dependent sacrificial sulfur transferase LarE [Oscillospiraceae bacterium]
MTLAAFFAAHPKAALAFSGGADSAYLLYEARRLGCDVRPYYVKTAFQPAFELRDAERLCRELGVELTVLELDILAQESVRQNPRDRCAHCKGAIFSAILEAARRDGYAPLLDGNNADDDPADRPGMAAAEKLGVLSPLRLCGISKAELRQKSREAGLFTWDKPAYACLATRIPTETPIDAETLRAVEASEDALRAMGFRDLRVRVREGYALLQFSAAELEQARARRAEIQKLLSPWFPVLKLDPEGR